MPTPVFCVQCRAPFSKNGSCRCEDVEVPEQGYSDAERNVYENSDFESDDDLTY